MPGPKAKSGKKKRASDKRSTQQKFTVAEVTAALEQAHGKVSEAARILTRTTGKTCSHVAVLNYCKRYPELQAKREDHRRRRDARVAAALEQSNGYISPACDILERMTGEKWTFGTLDSYIKKRPDLLEKYEDLRNRLKDCVEMAFIRRAMAGSDSLMLQLARTMLRDRGYGERLDVSSEVRHSGEVTVKHYTRADLEGMSPADRAAAYRDITRGEAKVIELQPKRGPGRPKKSIA